MILIDLTGQTYGNLTVIERASNDARREARWICQCGCGNTVTVLGSNLRNGRQRSCGCKKRLPRSEAAFNFLYRALRKNARERGYDWALTPEQVKDISQKPCLYCGAEPYQEIKDGYNGYNGGLTYNGLDRVDNSKGYVIENVVPCCGMCNYAKRQHSVDDFKSWARRLYEHWAGR